MDLDSYIQSMVGGGEGPEGTDPVDTVFLNFDTTTSETGSIHFTTRGSSNNLEFAASPRLAGTTGGPQPYVAFFAGNNRTLSDLPDVARLRLMTEFFNTAEIAPSGQGADPLAVTWSLVDVVAPPL